MMSAWNSLARVGTTVLLLVTPTGGAFAKPGGSEGRSEPSGTTITAEKMTVQNQDNRAVFEGSVVMTKGSLVVHSDTMVVSFKTQGQSASRKAGGQAARRSGAGTDHAVGERGDGGLPTIGSRSVSMIEAMGRVRIEKDDGTATCQKAVYYGDEEKIVLTGEPVAWQKGARVTGQKITLYLVEDRSVVEGGSRVMIEPEEAQRR